MRSSLNVARCARIGVCVLAVSAWAGPALGGVVLDSRLSEISASAKASGDTLFGEAAGPNSVDSKTATGTDLMAGPAGEAAASSTSGAGLNTATGTAFQTSFVTLDGADLAGAVATGEVSFSNVASAFGGALTTTQSDFAITFTVTGAPVEYVLSGSLTASQGGAMLLRLFNTATPAVSIQTFSNDAVIATGGVLAPGQYTLDFDAGVGAFTTAGTQSGSGSYVVTLDLVIPEPASASAAGMMLAGLVARCRRTSGR